MLCKGSRARPDIIDLWRRAIVMCIEISMSGHFPILPMFSARSLPSSQPRWQSVHNSRSEIRFQDLPDLFSRSRLSSRLRVGHLGHGFKRPPAHHRDSACVPGNCHVDNSTNSGRRIANRPPSWLVPSAFHRAEAERRPPSFSSSRDSIVANDFQGKLVGSRC